MTAQTISDTAGLRRLREAPLTGKKEGTDEKAAQKVRDQLRARGYEPRGLRHGGHG